MGADIKKLRNRIRSVDSTLHLTKAMGLVASSKIRKATDMMQKSAQYTDAFYKSVQDLIACPEADKSPYLQKRDTDKLCLIVVAGDRGLAGGYNANVFRFLKQYTPVSVIAVGKRASDKFQKERIEAEGFTSGMGLSIAKEVLSGFLQGDFDKVGIVYTRFVSIMLQQTDIKWILPLEREKNRRKSSVIFEPDEQTVLSSVIEEYVSSVIVSCIRESFASEVAARRFAMDSAGKNAQAMLDDLSIRYNRARQGAITQEITEIVAGSDA